MKMWILAAAMMFGLTVSAQEKKDRLSTEQRTELQTKKMALALDLNDKQQGEMKKLLLDRNKKMESGRKDFKASREAGKKFTADEKFAMKSKMLDERIASKKEMQKILTPEQFQKLEAMKAEKPRKITKKGNKMKKHHRR